MFNKTWALDALERIVATFIMAGGGAIITLGFSDWQQWAQIGGYAAVGALVKAVAGTRVGNPESASVLPTRQP